MKKIFFTLAFAFVGSLMYSQYSANVIDSYVKEPVYQKGNDEFYYAIKHLIEGELKKNVDGQNFVVELNIDKQGNLTSAKVDSKLSEAMESRLEAKIKEINGKWNPATQNGIAVDYTLYLDFRKEFNFEKEKKTFDKMDRRHRSFDQRDPMISTLVL